METIDQSSGPKIVSIDIDRGKAHKLRIIASLEGTNIGRLVRGLIDEHIAVYEQIHGPVEEYAQRRLREMQAKLLVPHDGK